MLLMLQMTAVSSQQCAFACIGVREYQRISHTYHTGLASILSAYFDAADNFRPKLSFQ